MMKVKFLHTTLHILNKATNFDAKYLKRRYEYNLNNFTQKKLFVYIKFSVEKKRLNYVPLCLPDENGNVIEEMILLDRENLKLMAA